MGVFGGTFDPIHIGHVVAATTARHALALDCVLLVVANVPWQKEGTRQITAAGDRLAMVEAVAAGIEGLSASAIEIERGGDSYTADTLEQLQEQHPHAELFLVIGADLVPQLETWARPDRLRQLATLAVVTRGADVPDAPGWRTHRVDIPRLDISSTELRVWAAEGRPIDGLVPEPAVRLIRERGLYAGRR